MALPGSLVLCCLLTSFSLLAALGRSAWALMEVRARRAIVNPGMAPYSVCGQNGGRIVCRPPQFLMHGSGSATMSRAGNAAVMSLILPGAGQFYNGHFWRGIFWLIVTPGLWIGSGGLLGWVCHVVSAITAYRKAVEAMGFDPS